MEQNWKDIKTRAKELSSKNKWNVWKPVLVLIGVGLIFGLIVNFLRIKYDSTIFKILMILLDLVIFPVDIGLTAYFLKLTRGEKVDLKILTKYYSDFWGIFALEFVMSILAILWSILFIIPGIIVAISYSLVFYLYIDNPGKSIKEYLNTSKEMMNGYKMDFFLFTLSFIGWELLSLVTCGVAAIWIEPYEVYAITMYLDELKKKREQELGDKSKVIENK